MCLDRYIYIYNIAYVANSKSEIPKNCLAEKRNKNNQIPLNKDIIVTLSDYVKPLSWHISMFPCDATWCACNGISLGIAWDHFCWFFSPFSDQGHWTLDSCDTRIQVVWETLPLFFQRFQSCGFLACYGSILHQGQSLFGSLKSATWQVSGCWRVLTDPEVWRCTRISIDHIQPLHLDNLQWPHFDLTGIIVSKGNYPPLARFQVREILYSYNLPRVHSHYITPYWRCCLSAIGRK